MTDDEKKTNEGSEPAEKEAPKEPNAHEAHQGKFNLGKFIKSLGKKNLIAICASALAVVAITVGIFIAVTSGNHGGGNDGGGNSGGGGDENLPCAHTFGDWITETEATCTEDGEKYRECTLCSEKETETIAATGHTEVIDAAVDATCKKTGLTEGKHCSSCGEVLIAQTVIAAKGHTEVIDAAVDATCKKTGLTEGKHCSVCGDVLIAQIETPLTAHTYDNSDDDTCNVCGFVRDLSCKHTNTEIIYGYDTSCTVPGLTNGEKCKDCGEILISQQVIDAIGHTEVIDAAVDATCTETGLTEGKHCSVCGEVLVEQTIVDSLGHAWKECTYPTVVCCQYKGCYDLTTHVCSRCDEEIVSQGLGHIESDWTVETAATCTANGKKYKYCLRGGDILTEDIIPSTGHTEVIDAAVNATCTKTGLTEGKHCLVCGEVLVEQTIVDALGHDYDGNGTCTRCGKGEASSIQAGLYDANDNLVASWDTLVNTYGMDVSGYYTSSNYKTVASSPYYILTNKSELSSGVKLVIDNDVTSIGTYAFRNCPRLTSVTIPDSVTSIGDCAFAYCYSLTSITIPDSVTSIGDVAFGSCRSLAFNEYDNAYYLGNVSNPYHALIKSKSLDISSCIIHDDTVLIANCAFSDHYSLTSITIPDSVTSIGESAFFHCERLTSVTIPDSVTSIGDVAFGSCRSLAFNEYDNAYYLGNESNPYYALIKSKTSDISSCIIHDDTVLIAYRAFEDCYSLTSITIPDSVTSICDSAFEDCDSLTNVTIPDSVTSIGERAFFDCDALTSITIPDSVTSIGEDAFEWCGNLKSVTVGNSVTSIGDEAFSGCYSLTSITIPDSVTSIGERAFSDCTSLTSITVDENNPNYKSIDGNLYTKDGKTLVQYAIGKADTSFVVPDGVTSIGGSAFESCNSLTSITIPDSVTSIGGSAFSGCASLTSIKIPDGVTSIGDSAFEYCDSLTSITIPDSVTSIGERAFRYCTSLTSVTIPDSVTSICDSAFEHCDSLTSITIPDSVTSIGRYAFCRCYNLTTITIPDSVTSIGEEAFRVCNSLTSITIPDSVTSIGDYAFYGCNSLTSVTIGNSVTSIGDYAFYGCNSLTSVTIGNSVTSIGDCAFSDCDRLTSVTIPDSVTSIGYDAFSECARLTSVTIGNSVTSIGGGAFEYCTSLRSITVDENNPNYKSIDGNLYTRDGKTLVQYAIGKTNTSFVIPDGVTSIGKWAFYYCDSLTTITIPDSVTSIGDSAFRDCTSLTSIMIPDSVTSIGGSAFNGCYSLTIYCEAASKPSGWNYYWNSSDRPVVWGYTGE